MPFTANPGLAVDTASAACPAPAGEVLFKREPGQHAAAPAPLAPEAAPVHEAPVGLVGPEVVPSEVHPGSPEEIAAAQEHVKQMAAADQELEVKKQEVLQDHEVQQFQHDAQVLHDKSVNLGQKFGHAFNGVLDHLNFGNLLGGNGKVEAAKPCPFLVEGASIAFNADAEIAQGSFVSFVSGLAVVSVQANIAGQQAVVTVPAGVAGQVYTFITNRSIDDNKLVADAISFGPAIVESKSIVTPIHQLQR